MLYRIRSDSTTDVPAIVSGQFLARNKLSKKARARLAANIVNGNVKIGDLTIGQIAHLCRVSRSNVNAIRRPPTPPESLAQRFARSTTDERRELARTAGVDVIWDQLIHPLI